MNRVASHGQDSLTPLDGRLHKCKQHPSLHVFVGRKKRSQLMNLSMRRFIGLSVHEQLVANGFRIRTKQNPSRTPERPKER